MPFYCPGRKFHSYQTGWASSALKKTTAHVGFYWFLLVSRAFLKFLQTPPIATASQRHADWPAGNESYPIRACVQILDARWEVCSVSKALRGGKQNKSQEPDDCLNLALNFTRAFWNRWSKVRGFTVIFVLHVSQAILTGVRRGVMEESSQSWSVAEHWIRLVLLCSDIVLTVYLARAYIM